MCKTPLQQIGALTAFVLLVACTTADESGSAIANSKWRFVTIDGQKPVSSKAELTIGSDRIGANVGCNGLGGDLRIKGGKLVVGGVVSTMMYCEGIMDQERAVSELLSADPDYQIEDGRLVLRGGSHSAELERAE
jgi:heat shock protein HslJ